MYARLGKTSDSATATCLSWQQTEDKDEDEDEVELPVPKRSWWCGIELDHQEKHKSHRRKKEERYCTEKRK